MTEHESAYPIGTPGTPWGDAEREAWRATQRQRRSYRDDVLAVVDRLRSRFDVFEYGRLDCAGEAYPLMAIRTRGASTQLPVALITGGVHGYETSGVHGALQFVDQHAERYAGRIELLI